MYQVSIITDQAISVIGYLGIVSSQGVDRFDQARLVKTDMLGANADDGTILVMHMSEDVGLFTKVVDADLPKITKFGK